MKVAKLILTSAAILTGSILSAQSLAIYVEPGQILSSGGTPVSFGETVNGSELNAFFGFVSQDFDFGVGDPMAPDLEWAKTTLGGIEWSPMLDGTPAGVDFMTPGAELGPTNSLVPGNSGLAIGSAPVIAFMNSAGPGALDLTSEIAVAVGDPFLSEFDNRAASVQQGAFNVIAGMEGSIQMVNVVPEPAHFAALFGLVGLGLVVIRRRRRS